MPKTKPYEALHERVLARPGAKEHLAKLRQEYLAEIGLYELRRSQEISQTVLAERLGVTQPAISKLENAEDLRLSTLRDYVEALGGRLEIRVHFDGEDVTLDLSGRGDAA